MFESQITIGAVWMLLITFTVIVVGVLFGERALDVVNVWLDNYTEKAKESIRASKTQ